MPDAFCLRWKLDRPCVEQDKAEDVYALVTIEPNAAELAQSSQMVLPAHIILLVDVSGSMDVLMRHDPQAQTVGEVVTEGRASDRVVSEVPSRREMTGAVVQKLAERLHADDLLTVVAFDDKAHVLAQCISPANMDALWPALQRLGEVGGGGTTMGQGFEAVRQILATGTDLHGTRKLFVPEFVGEKPPVVPGPEVRRTRKLIVLTDGEDDKPDEALAQAQALSQDFNVPIAAFGMGECKVAFLKDVAQTTLAGSFNHIRSESDADQLFHQVLTGQKNIQATNVQCKLWLSPEMQVRELYRTRPEILYVGDLAPDANNQVALRLEQMERGKAYEFLFRCTVPRRQANQRFRIAKVTLIYDVPTLDRSQETIEANLVVEYTADPERARERSGDVRRVFSRAEVQRQVLFLQAKADLLNHGQGNDRDRAMVAKVLQALVHKFDEFADQAMANQFRQMQEELLSKGTISQEMLNRSLAASSRAEEVVVAQDIDF